VFTYSQWKREKLFHECIIGPIPMWRQQIHEEYGYFDGDFIIAGDYEFWFRISQTHNFKFINKFIGLYSERATSVGNADSPQRIKEDFKIKNEFISSYLKGEI